MTAPLKPGKCKNCRARIEDEEDGFCRRDDDRCWFEWCAKEERRQRDDTEEPLG